MCWSFPAGSRDSAKVRYMHAGTCMYVHTVRSCAYGCATKRYMYITRAFRSCQWAFSLFPPFRRGETPGRLFFAALLIFLAGSFPIVSVFLSVYDSAEG